MTVLFTEEIHREAARSLRREAIERVDRSPREELMLLAIEQEMLAELLEDSDRCLES
jgi:hypothetical protein